MVWLVSGALYAIGSLLLWRRLRAASGLVLGVVFSATWMIGSAIYLDCNPRTYAQELYREIGGGWSSLGIAGMYCLFVLGMLVVFTHARMEKLGKLWNYAKVEDITVKGVSLNVLGTCVLVVFVVALYVKLLQYPIPILTGLDRYSYRVKYEHFFLKVLYKYKDFISLFAGVLFLYHMRRGYGRWKTLTMAAFLSILVYFVLIGNKFSTPFFSLCMFLIPLSVLGISRSVRKCWPVTPGRNIGRYKGICVAVAVIVVLFGVGIYKYYTGFRRREVEDRLAQRIAVKQSQLWWSADRRVRKRGRWNSAEAFSGVFTNPPFGKHGNTALRYLMYRDIGRSRTRYCIKHGYLYTGAYPTILLELFGPVFSYPAGFICSLVFAMLLYWLCRAIIRHHYLTVFFGAFVFQPVMFMLIGGNMYFVMKWQFAVKVCLVIFAVLCDTRREWAVLQAPRSSDGGVIVDFGGA